MITAAQELYEFATRHAQTLHYIRSSFANLDRKRFAGTYTPDLAIRLLRNNAIDAAKAFCRDSNGYKPRMFKAETLDSVAAMLLTDWSNRHD